jgi:hypothetical protein
VIAYPSACQDPSASSAIRSSQALLPYPDAGADP